MFKKLNMMKERLNEINEKLKDSNVFLKIMMNMEFNERIEKLNTYC